MTYVEKVLKDLLGKRDELLNELSQLNAAIGALGGDVAGETLPPTIPPPPQVEPLESPPKKKRRKTRSISEARDWLTQQTEPFTQTDLVTHGFGAGGGNPKAVRLARELLESLFRRGALELGEASGPFNRTYTTYRYIPPESRPVNRPIKAPPEREVRYVAPQRGQVVDGTSKVSVPAKYLRELLNECVSGVRLIGLANGHHMFQIGSDKVVVSGSPKNPDVTKKNVRRQLVEKGFIR